MRIQTKHRFQNEKWMIKESFYSTMMDVINKSDIEDEPMIPIEPDDECNYDVVGNIGVLHVSGVLMKYPSIEEILFYGAVDMNYLGETLMDMVEDTKIEKILLHLNSPGGTCRGMETLCDIVSKCNSKKSITVYSDDLLCSAAYELASYCDNIIVDPESIVGSVGVFYEHYSISEYLKNNGITVTVFRGGKYKNEENQNEPLRDETKERITKEIQDIYNQFVSIVKSNRPSVDEINLQGQTFDGKQSIEIGLADGTATSIDEVISLLETN